LLSKTVYRTQSYFSTEAGRNLFSSVRIVTHMDFLQSMLPWGETPSMKQMKSLAALSELNTDAQTLSMVRTHAINALAFDATTNGRRTVSADEKPVDVDGCYDSTGCFADVHQLSLALPTYKADLAIPASRIGTW
jgi:hypothetical protein